MSHTADSPAADLTDAHGSFAHAIAAMRERYLAERLPGETADAWLRRTGRRTGYFAEAADAR